MKTFVVLLCFAAGAVPLMAQTPSGDEFVLIRGGTFTMGSPTTEAWREKDEVQHRVTLRNFYMGKYEVTQASYREVMGNNPSESQGATLPVENISWLEAVQYCNARSVKEGLTPAYTINAENVRWNQNANGYRLPTEAEWEYACRAGTTTPFNTENSISPEQSNYFGHYPYTIEDNYFAQNKLETRPGEYRQRPVPVGSFAANKWGLFDMHGNAGEWCWDWYGGYGSGAQTNPTGPEAGTMHVSRGGGWNDFAKHIRSAYRCANPPSHKMFNLGFRLVRSAG
jgi:formylglycine-generating enzyme required for sulfatase activity